MISPNLGGSPDVIGKVLSNFHSFKLNARSIELITDSLHYVINSLFDIILAYVAKEYNFDEKSAKTLLYPLLNVMIYNANDIFWGIDKHPLGIDHIDHIEKELTKRQQSINEATNEKDQKLSDTTK